MKSHIYKTSPFHFLMITLSIASAASEGKFDDVSQRSIDGGGRNIMRTSEGGIVAAFAKMGAEKTNLLFSRSLDDGNTWDDVIVNDLAGQVDYVAVDSNFKGSYVAFSEGTGDEKTGRIAYFSSPFASQARYSISQRLTPATVIARDTSIQASRKGWGNTADKGRETVAYGWQDSRTKFGYIGVSSDGVTFPEAKLVIQDSYATSGPAVAIRGNYVVATYKTTNPAIVPADVPTEQREGRSYLAWIESWDGGTSWSQPAPLFGRNSSDFPMAQIDLSGGKHDQIRLAGGSTQPNSPILNWAGTRESLISFVANADKTNIDDPTSGKPSFLVDKAEQSLQGTTFVQSSMRGIDVDGKQGEVSVVSFRSIEPGAVWKHAIANNPLAKSARPLSNASAALRNEPSAPLAPPPAVPAPSGDSTSRVDAATSQFQYSALIDTAVRATIYKEAEPLAGKVRLIAAVSTDTGKTFNRHVSFGKDDLIKLGITVFDETTVFAASQCLFEDRNGEVYLDIIVSNDTAMHYAKIPIGVNVKDLKSE